MKTTDNYYTHLTNLPKLPQKYIDLAYTSAYEFPSGQHPDTPNRKPEVWRSVDRITEFEQTDFALDLQNHFGEIQAYYNIFQPGFCTDWHVDYTRKSNINWLINDVVDTVTLFREPFEQFRYIKEIKRLKYELCCPVLFNSGTEHAIFNYSNQKRYMFTIGFCKPGITYYDIKDYLMSLKIDQY